MKFHIKNQHDRVQMFNLRNKVCQQQFLEYTSTSNTLSNCFVSNETLDVQFKRWQKKFIKALHASFRIVRVTNREKKMSKIDMLMKEKKELLEKNQWIKKDRLKLMH